MGRKVSDGYKGHEREKKDPAVRDPFTDAVPFFF